MDISTRIGGKVTDQWIGATPSTAPTPNTIRTGLARMNERLRSVEILVDTLNEVATEIAGPEIQKDTSGEAAAAPIGIVLEIHSTATDLERIYRRLACAVERIRAAVG